MASLAVMIISYKLTASCKGQSHKNSTWDTNEFTTYTRHKPYLWVRYVRILKLIVVIMLGISFISLSKKRKVCNARYWISKLHYELIYSNIYEKSHKVPKDMYTESLISAIKMTFMLFIIHSINENCSRSTYPCRRKYRKIFIISQDISFKQTISIFIYVCSNYAQ